MAKTNNNNNEVENLFSNGFDVEGEDNNNKSQEPSIQKNKESSSLNLSNDKSPFLEDPIDNVIENKKEVNVKNVEHIELSNEFIKDVDNTFNVFDFEKESTELFLMSKKLALINDDDDNKTARELAKQMTTLKNKIEEARKEANKPDQQRIDGRMESAKKITEPITKEVDRLKQCISFYENEKERKRLAEKKKLEDEIKAKEERDKKERERVQNIRKEIDRLRIDGQAKVNACNTIKEVNDFELKLKGWKLKPEFFAEFIEEADDLKNEISLLLAKRKPLIEEIENKRLEAEKLEGENKIQAEKEAEAKRKELEAQNKLREEEQRNTELQEKNMEMAARQELIILIASFGIKSNIEDYIKGVTDKYISCRLAMENREKLIEDYKQHLQDKVNMDSLESEKVKNVRLTFEFEIVDESLIPREFLSIDEAKIRKYIQENRKELEKDINAIKINGLILYPKKHTIIK